LLAVVISSLVECLVSSVLMVHCRTVGAGLVWAGSLGYRCFPDAPDKIRKPDVSFVRQERFRTEYLREGFLTIVPDLAVEVLSPNDLAYEVDQKIEEYVDAGVPLIWVINPETRIVEIHRKDGTVTKLHEGAELADEDVLPGFRCRVADLFPPAGSDGSSAV
jgi:Uma2 family endonuclease